MADKALLLGINKYKAVSHLRGCENDVKDMRDLLVGTFGFRPDAVKTLVNADVTKAKVRPLLKGLFEDARPGDRVVLHFAGHGSYTADTDGDEEGDAVDELLCLHDMDFGRKNSYFLDDELRDWTQGLPGGVQLVVFLDNCHSGTGTRMIRPAESPLSEKEAPLVHVRATVARTAERGARAAAPAALAEESLTPDSPDVVLARFVEPPPEIVAKARRRGRRFARSAIVAGMNHLLLAACRDDQTAADAFIDGEFHGAFTYHVCHILRDSGAALDRGSLIQRLNQALQAGHFEQVAQLEGSTGLGPLFRTASEETNGAPPTGTAPPVPAVPPRPVAPAPARQDLPRLLEEFLAAYNRLLAAGGSLPGGLPARGHEALVGERHLVYVHGICQHDPGYSDDWWAALQPFAPSLAPGDRAQSGNRHEVLWSDLVRSADRSAAALPKEEREARERIVETLQDRSQRETLAAILTPTRGLPGEAAGVRAMFGIPGVDCINDFLKYLFNGSIRARVIGTFAQVVRPLLEGGARVDVISHSWGTVVAYEALRMLDGNATLPNGSVLNFFTVGSALSISEVKRRLLPQNRDGQRPRLVGRWINLDARNDVVGGPLQGNPFAVDEEFLNLHPVGCRPFPPDPACAHSSYFRADNRAVNADVFGRFLEG